LLVDDPSAADTGRHSDIIAHDNAAIVDHVRTIMNTIAKDVAAAGFDPSAWKEDLLALNPWARGLTIDEANAEFASARQEATLARHAEGKEVWNGWANGMLALKDALEAAGQWDMRHEEPRREVHEESHLTLTFPHQSWVGENEATRIWLALASAVFSTADLEHRFEAKVSFSSFVFPRDAVLNRATFSGYASFESATFMGNAKFDLATFNDDAVLNRATFSGYASFESATFKGNANFDLTTFNDDIVLNRATFSGYASFWRAIFCRGVISDKAIFRGEALFERATFSGHAQFVSSTFMDNAIFRLAAFNDYTTFKHAKFNREARFWSATFGSNVLFNSVTFSGDANFSNATFSGEARFWSTTFQQCAMFDSVSAAAFSLADTEFNQVPSFIGATFKGTLRLDNVETPRYRWTFGYTPDKDATARFRELRRQAAEAQDRERELEFFAQEIRTGRFHAKGLPSWVPKIWSWRFWFGLGFGALSDFGRSLWRPLLAWLALTALCSTFYLGEHDDMRKARTALAPSGFFNILTAHAVTTRNAWDNPPACREPFASTDAVNEAILLSLKNALVLNIVSADSARRSFGCLYGLEKDGGRVPAIVAKVSIGQTVMSGLLIFLFVLAVRNLLRLKS
jgi:hypothetical protein